MPCSSSGSRGVTGSDANMESGKSMARRLTRGGTSSEVVVPAEVIDLDRVSPAQLQVESSTYGSAYVYGSAAAWNPVSNAAELQSAIASGVAHIQIRNHLDLTSLQPPPGATHILGTVPSSVKSITGNCELPVSSIALLQRGLLAGVPLLPQRPQQCLLVHNDNLLDLSSSSLWIDNVYLRVGPQPTFPTAVTMTAPEQQVLQVNERPRGRLWLTDVIIQSNGAAHSIGIDVQSNSDAYLQGVTFANFNGTATPAHVGHPGGRATLSMVGCAFLFSSLTPSPSTSGLITAWGSAAIRAQACTMTDCDADWSVRQAGTGRAAVYADALPEPGPDALGAVQGGAARPLAEAGGQFLTSGDTWALDTRQAVISAFGVRNEDSLRSSTSRIGVSLRLVLIIVGVAAVAGALLVYVGHSLTAMRERRHRRLHRAGAATSSGPGPLAPQAAGTESRRTSRQRESGAQQSNNGSTKLESSSGMRKSGEEELQLPALTTRSRVTDTVSASGVFVPGMSQAGKDDAHDSGEVSLQLTSAQLEL